MTTTALPSLNSPRGNNADPTIICSTNPTFMHTRSVVAAVRATTAAAAAIMAKSSNKVTELHTLHAVSTTLASPRSGRKATPRDRNSQRQQEQQTQERPHTVGHAALPASGRMATCTTADSARSTARNLDKGSKTSSNTVELLSPKPAASTPVGDVFPSWIRERKDFQVFFPRYADRVITDEEILRLGVPKEPSERNIVELQCLARWIMKIPSMATFLDLNQATEIAKLARYEMFQPREFVFRKGDKGDACYLIFSGEVHVLIDGQKVASVTKNATFGDIALQIENATRGADVQAAFPAVLANGGTNANGPLIGVEVLKILAEDYHKTLARSQNRRRKHLINWLHTEVSIFRDCVESKLHFFELVSIDVSLKKGDVLYRQGEIVGALYIVKSGQIRLEVDIQYEHKHRWPCGVHEWKEQVHAAKARVPFHIETSAGFFGFEMFVENQQTRLYTVIADSPTVELVALNRVDCFSPYFSFTPRAIERILAKHEKCHELAHQQIRQKLKDFRKLSSAQKKATTTGQAIKQLPVTVRAKFPHSMETPQYQFPCLQPAKWEATNETVRALQLACQ